MTDQPDPARPSPQKADLEPQKVGAALPPLGCTPSFAELFRYMDGALDDDRRALLKSHLDDCGCCHETYSFQTVLRQMIELRCQVDLPDDLPGRIFGSLDDPDPS